MERVATRRVVAAVKDVQTRRDGSEGEFPRHAVRVGPLADLDLKVAVAGGQSVRLPFPTSGAVAGDFRPKPFGQGSIGPPAHRPIPRFFTKSPALWVLGSNDVDVRMCGIRGLESPIRGLVGDFLHWLASDNPIQDCIGWVCVVTATLFRARVCVGNRYRMGGATVGLRKDPSGKTVNGNSACILLRAPLRAAK